MKINLYNSAKSYSVTLCAEDDGIWDTLTGEVYVTCGWDEDDIAEEDYSAWNDDYWDDGCPNDDVDESNYDPYAGCDMYEVEPIDYGY